MIKPIEILTPNLLEEGIVSDLNAEVFEVKQGRKNIVSGGFTVAFTESRSFSKILIKNTDITEISILYKVENSAETYTVFEDFTLTKSGRDILISFEPNLSASTLKFVFCDAPAQVFFNNFILAETLLNLDKVLSSFTPSNYRRGGYHYTADGSLISWREFTKNSGSLSLENVPDNVKKELEYLCEENVFLTFIFYGAYDLSQSCEYALTAPFKAEVSRNGGLWSVYLEITEK